VLLHEERPVEGVVSQPQQHICLPDIHKVFKEAVPAHKESTKKAQRKKKCRFQYKPSWQAGRQTFAEAGSEDSSLSPPGPPRTDVFVGQRHCRQTEAFASFSSSSRSSSSHSLAEFVQQAGCPRPRVLHLLSRLEVAAPGPHLRTTSSGGDI
jgi:hypothetical protein